MDRGKSFWLKWATVIDRLTKHIEQPAESLPADGNLNRFTQIDDGHASPQPGCAAHGDGAHHVGANMLLDLQDQVAAVLALHKQGIIDGGEISRSKFNINNYADQTYDHPWIFIFSVVSLHEHP